MKITRVSGVVHTCSADGLPSLYGDLKLFDRQPPRVYLDEVICQLSSSPSIEKEKKEELVEETPTKEKEILHTHTYRSVFLLSYNTPTDVHLKKKE